jgi:short-subunit dehydrogenase
MADNCFSIITGASKGFGKALALECAKRKMNLILVSLPGPELDSLASLIRNMYKVEVIAVGKDLSMEENCIALFEEVGKMNVHVNMLINNAGIGNTNLFSDGSIAFYQKQVNLNVMATMLLTRLFLDMLRKNRTSYILNVGSLSSFFFLAKKQVYGGTKSFIYFFSKSLKRELEADHVHVSVICPGSMNTNPGVTLVNKKLGWLSKSAVMDPEVVASIAIHGLLNHKEVIIPGFLNKIFLVVDKLLPSFLIKMITNRKMKLLNSVQQENPAIPAEAESSIPCPVI